MPPSRLAVGAAACLALVALAGCGGLLGSGSSTPTPTVTPAPVPEVTTTADGPTPTRTSGVAGPPALDANASRYASLRPTCERPPGLVIHIQVAALAHNDPETDDGIRTTWRFAAPSNRAYTGPFPNFVEIITTGYRPLLEARRIAYGPMNRTGDRAQRRVRVTTANGTTATYLWRLEKQSGGEYDGCWMTTGVLDVGSRAG